MFVDMELTADLFVPLYTTLVKFVPHEAARRGPQQLTTVFGTAGEFRSVKNDKQIGL